MKTKLPAIALSLLLLAGLSLLIASCKKIEYAVPTTVPSKPSLGPTTDSTGSANSTSIIIFGNVTSNGGSPIIQEGVVYTAATIGTTPTLDTAKANHTGLVAATTAVDGKFVVNVTALPALTAGKSYHFKTYAYNSIGINYGTDFVGQFPTVATLPLSNVTSTSVTANGNVSFDGGSNVTERGVVYGTSATIDTTIASGGKKIAARDTTVKTGAYTVAVSGLTSGTLYYFRAYAINALGISYGSAVTATASVSVTPTTNATSTGVTTGGSVNSSGGGTIVERGVVYNAVGGALPVLGTDPKVADPSAVLGPYTTNVTSLTAGTNYQFRAYVTTSAGLTFYSTTTTTGPIATFGTTTATPTAVGVTPIGASVSSSIATTGGGTISARGVVYDTTSSPSFAPASASGKKTDAAITSGAFTEVITGLKTGTTYYVWPYVTTSAGTFYGARVSFKTN